MDKPSKLLEGKLGVVFGVANKRSIAWAIAQAWAAGGREAGFHLPGGTAQGERGGTGGHVRRGHADPALRCHRDEEIAAVFRGGGAGIWQAAPAAALGGVSRPRRRWKGEFVNTSREAFRIAQDVSAYSLVALARAAAPLMTEGGSILAMSYYGAEKVVPHYNVMGVAKASLEACTRYLAYDLGPQKIRVNCISAGPVNTLAARGISGFTRCSSITRPTRR